MKRLIGHGLLFVFFVARSSGASAACAWSDLTADELTSIDQGKDVMCTVNESTSPWPRTFIYQAINSTPEQAASVFTDFDEQTKFVPSVKECHSTLLAPLDWNVDYKIDVPVVSDETYTSHTTLSRNATADTYRVEWTMVKASSTKYFEGNAEFQPYTNGRTLLVYENFVIPGNGLAGIGFIKKRALQQVEAAVKAHAAHIEKLLKDEPTTVSARVQTIEDMFVAATPTPTPTPTPGTGH